jgi:hypothetical protein
MRDYRLAGSEGNKGLRRHETMAGTLERDAFLAAVSDWLEDREVHFEAEHLAAWLGQRWRNIERLLDADRWAEEYAAELISDGPFRKRSEHVLLPRGTTGREIIRRLRLMHGGRKVSEARDRWDGELRHDPSAES